MTLANQDRDSPAWAALRQHHSDMAATTLRALFSSDEARANRYRLEACGLFLDYSRHLINDDTLVRLQNLAEESGVQSALGHLFAGKPVNNTEDRPALHPALRRFGNEAFPTAAMDVMPKVRATRDRMREFVGRLRSGRLRGITERPLTTVVSLGIGGSHLGPALACEALGAYGTDGVSVRFVSNLDGAALERVLGTCRAEETLILVASKSFTTEETLTNAQSARDWIKQHLGDDPAIERRHFAAVTANANRAIGLGIDPANVFEFWDWVGGRYSLWSAVGLPLAITIGMDAFEEMLRGASEMDSHVQSAPPQANMPIILALIEIWYRNLFGAATRAVIPYDFGLARLPDYLRQLEMESNGKRVSRDGEPLNHPTAPVVWGTSGSDGQHAFFQLMHQGNTLIPSDFIVPLESQGSLPGHQPALLANALAQITTLMRGRDLAETEKTLKEQGMSKEEAALHAPHRVLPGNQPTSLLIYEQLDSRTFGALIALYEHKVFVESVIWNINAFDQWGVEHGKTVAQSIRPAVEAAHRAGRRSNESLGQRVSRLMEACSDATR